MAVLHQYYAPPTLQPPSYAYPQPAPAPQQPLAQHFALAAAYAAPQLWTSAALANRAAALPPTLEPEPAAQPKKSAIPSWLQQELLKRKLGAEDGPKRRASGDEDEEQPAAKVSRWKESSGAAAVRGDLSDDEAPEAVLQVGFRGVAGTGVHGAQTKAFAGGVPAGERERAAGQAQPRSEDTPDRSAAGGNG